MGTYEIQILEPRTKDLLDELAKLSLVRIQKIQRLEGKERKFGSVKGLVVSIGNDFDAPLEHFKKYL